MTTNEYAIQTERRLIAEFKKEFYEKVGYIPLVLSKYQLPEDQVGYMSLEKLKHYFTPYLPERFNKTVPLHSKARYREIVELRLIYCYLAKSMKYTLTSIGRILGGKDHTTIVHNLAQFQNLMETDDNFRVKYKMIFEHIRQQEQAELDGTSIMEYLQKLQSEPKPIVLSGLLSV